MRVAIILVHYRTPALLEKALAAIGATTAGLGVDLERIVVDTGSDPTDHSIIGALRATVIRPGENLGYAAAVNRGISSSTADACLLMNPDVLVRPGCVARLLDRLQEGAAAAGPRFWWDRRETLMLPPTERRDLRDELRRAMAQRGPTWARGARRRWRAHARSHWEAQEPIASHELSGALMAVSRAAWSRVGPFDEGYRLYFEETDWLHRLRAAGLPAVHDPKAEAVHFYARSTTAEPRAAQWFAASERRFRQRHYDRRARWLLERVAPLDRAAGRPAAGDGPVTAPWIVPCPFPDSGSKGWVEVSEGATGFPAAAARPAKGAHDWTLPGEVRDRLGPGTYTLRAVSGEGAELAERTYVIPAGKVIRQT